VRLIQNLISLRCLIRVRLIRVKGGLKKGLTRDESLLEFAFHTDEIHTDKTNSDRRRACNPSYIMPGMPPMPPIPPMPPMSS